MSRRRGARGERGAAGPGEGPVAVRLAAARAVSAVAHGGQSLARALPALTDPIADSRDRALARTLAFGTVRYWMRYRWCLARLLQRPLKPGAALLEALLGVGLHQLDGHLRIPPHAAVAETVEAVRSAAGPGAAGLANAVLRRFQREREALHAAMAADDEAALALPRWWLTRLAHDWPDDWRVIAAAANAAAPMWLRVNLARQTLSAYRERLEAAGLAASPAAPPGLPAALRLDEPVDVAALPGFADGCVSVQDAAAQFAAPLLDAASGMRVLDACAAPGGKSAHLLECAPGIELLSLDSDAQRLERVRETLLRLGLSGAGAAAGPTPPPRVVAADAATPTQWWDGRAFDRILLDAPCSASGVIRRHPDIKLLRRDDDVAALQARQGRLLRALWPTLAAGGRLLYVTCSVLAAENDGVVGAFLAEINDARAEPPGLAFARKTSFGCQVLPGEDGMDGFYYACLRKTA